MLKHNYNVIKNKTYQKLLFEREGKLKLISMLKGAFNSANGYNNSSDLRELGGVQIPNLGP